MGNTIQHSIWSGYDTALQYAGTAAEKVTSWGGRVISWGNSQLSPSQRKECSDKLKSVSDWAAGVKNKNVVKILSGVVLLSVALLRKPFERTPQEKVFVAFKRSEEAAASMSQCASKAIEALKELPSEVDGDRLKVLMKEWESAAEHAVACGKSAEEARDAYSGKKVWGPEDSRLCAQRVAVMAMALGLWACSYNMVNGDT